MCQNIVHERITNYTIKKALKCIQIKKILKKTSILPIWKLAGNSSIIYLKLKKMQYTTLCRVGTRRRRPLYLQQQAIISKRVRRRALIPPRTHTPGKPSLSLSLDEFTFPFMRKLNKYNGLIQAMASKKVGCLQLPSCIYYVLHITSQRHQNPSNCILAVFTPHLSVVT